MGGCTSSGKKIVVQPLTKAFTKAIKISDAAIISDSPNSVVSFRSPRCRNLVPKEVF